jgi:hypothetical protein
MNMQRSISTSARLGQSSVSFFNQDQLDLRKTAFHICDGGLNDENHKFFRAELIYLLNLNSTYRTLEKSSYIQFTTSNDQSDSSDIFSPD